MTTMTKRARWAVPAGIGAVLAVAIAGPSLIASAAADLPELSAEELVARIAEAEPAALSGTAVYTARLGLPELPLEAQGPAGPLSLLGGSSTIRVWSDGAENARAAITGSLSEFSVVTSGSGTWTYSSGENEAIHYVLSPEDAARFEQSPRAGNGAATVPTPQEAADEFLGQSQEFTDFSVDAATQVAGRDAYQLGLIPTQDGTLVDRVLIAVDAETFTPLRVQVWSEDDSTAPAVETAFTDVSFQAPDPSTFDFTVPDGATTREVVVPLDTVDDARSEGYEAVGAPTVHGTGWEQVVELDGVDTASLLAGSSVSEAMPAPAPGSAQEQLLDEFGAQDEHGFSIDSSVILDALVTPVEGGHAITSTVASVYLTDDGRVLVGAVPVQTLIDLAG